MYTEGGVRRNDDDIETDARADRLYESDHDATEDGDDENAADAAEVMGLRERLMFRIIMVALWLCINEFSASR